ncbi:SSU ribosomal protein S5p (S2e), partial [hydrothermal vent metagenome]
NVLSKCIGTTRPVNVVRSTVNALSGISSPDYIAAKRGKTVEQILGE